VGYEKWGHEDHRITLTIDNAQESSRLAAKPSLLVLPFLGGTFTQKSYSEVTVCLQGSSEGGDTSEVCCRWGVSIQILGTYNNACND